MKDQDIAEILEELKKDTINTELIQDNKLHFEFNKEKYRVRMSTQKENSEAINYKNKVYIRLLQEKNDDGSPAHMMEKNIIILLKENNQVDIVELDKVAKKFEEEMGQIYITMYQKKDSEKKVIEKLKKELKVARDKRLDVVLEKAGYLSPAIENQVQDDYYRFMTAMCTEKLINKKEDKWEQVWIKFEDYEKDKSNFPYIALGKFTKLMYGV